MNKKPLVILVHGVGDHDDKNFKAQCVNTLDWASTQYAKVPKFSDACDVRSVAYDDIFDKVLANAREVSASGDAFKPSVSSVVQTLALYQDSIKDDNFFTENALDAVVYKSFLAGAVEAAAASRFYKIYNESILPSGKRRPVHIICHSLGTAVMTNVLHRLYSAKDLSRDRNKYLSLPYNQIRSITMLANVAPLFPRSGKPESTQVRPGSICETMINARHLFDLIPLLKPFNPDNDWSPVEMALYTNVEFTDIVDLVKLDTSIISAKEPKLNVHAVEHYLAQPNVHQQLFRVLYNQKYYPTDTECQAYVTKWKANSIVGAAKKLQSQFTQLNPDSDPQAQIDDLVKQYEALAAFFKSGS